MGSIIAPLVLNPTLASFMSPRALFRAPGAAFAMAAMIALLTILVLSLTPRARPAPS